MNGDGFGVVTLETPVGTGGGRHRSLTGDLGCTDVGVDAYRLGSGESADLPAGQERLCVPIDASAPLAVGDAVDLPETGVCRVPAGVGASVAATGPTWLLVVSAPGESAPGATPTVVDLERASFAVPATSDVATAHLTDPLGCTGTKTNARLLEPGQTVPYHTEGSQEELFVPVEGPAEMRVDGRRLDAPVGTVARVAPETPRSAVNDGDRDALWVMIGAPPTGGPTEWDPGAEIIE